MSRRLTTHVLDLARGLPACGLRIAVYRLASGGVPVLLAEAATNRDGRLNEPLLEGEALASGVYELLFYAGNYWLSQRSEWGPGEAVQEAAAAAYEEGQGSEAELPFLDVIPVRFRVTDARAHYHVPLLLAPGGYSTYRGS